MQNNNSIKIEPVKTFLPDQVVAYIIVGICALFFILFLIVPLVQILKTSFAYEGQVTFNNYVEYFGKARIRRSLYNSLYVACFTTIVTTIMAILVAYAITRTTIRGKTFYKSVSSLPLMAPSVVQALALISLFGRNGLITNWLSAEWDIYGPTGIIISEIFYCFPYALLILITTLSAVDTRLNEAAESLGAGPLKVFYKITIPSARYGIFSAAALSFNLTITDFGNPIVIGGDYNVLATEIYTQVYAALRSRRYHKCHPPHPGSTRFCAQQLLHQEKLLAHQRSGPTFSQDFEPIQKGDLFVCIHPYNRFHYHYIPGNLLDLYCRCLGRSCWRVEADFKMAHNLQSPPL
jgi:ABC-type spermidine/putrescine transport system permease subunit II